MNDLSPNDKQIAQRVLDELQGKTREVPDEPCLLEIATRLAEATVATGGLQLTTEKCVAVAAAIVREVHGKNLVLHDEVIGRQHVAEDGFYWGTLTSGALVGPATDSDHLMRLVAVTL